MSVPDVEYQMALDEIKRLKANQPLLAEHFRDIDVAEGHYGDEMYHTPSESAIRVMNERKATIKHLKAQLAAVISERDGHRGYAETVAKLHTENERLREALAPFAKATQYMGRAIDPEEAGVWTDSRGRCRITVATFQAATVALNRPAEGEGGGA